ncbi:MAG: phosphatidate cytidylyltransferase [Rhodospirillaceae bacterium]|nr:phosphatidate cytidylyltransferase [Rhodospirillaceae bacterium]
MTGIVLAPMFLLLVYWGFPGFHVLVAAIAGVMAWEFTRMDGEEGAKRRTLIAAASVAAVGAISFDAALIAWLIILVASIAVVVADQVAGRTGLNLVQGAVPYVAVPAVSLIFVSAAGGFQTVFWLLAVVWLTDIGAYACGRLIGGPKLWPAISPNKTWAGVIGGVIIGTFAGLVMLAFFNIGATAMFAGLSIMLAALTVVGDLFESGLKRKFQVKDSGGMLPGHGGVMDRFDGLWAAAPAAALLCWIFGGGVATW